MLVRGHTSRWGAFWIMAALAGCSALKSREVPLDSSAGLFDKAQLSYQVDTDRINSVPAPLGEAQLVSYQQQSVARLPSNAQASVEIRYPHPEKRPGYAQVRVRIEGHVSQRPAGAPAWKRWWIVTRDQLPGLNKAGTTHEIWTLDIPKGEVSQIVNRLHMSGYFAGYEKAEGTQIETELDGAKLSKSWHQIPEIDALVVRVRTEGRLALASKAPDKKATAAPKDEKDTGLFASVAHYRALLAKDKKTGDSEGAAVVSDQNDPGPASPVNAIEIVRLPAVGTTVR